MDLSYFFNPKNVFSTIRFNAGILLFIGIQAQCFGQNVLAVPFTSGFVGDVSGNNSCSNTVYLSSLGCTGIYFAQNSSTTVFNAQGNDILGSIVLTDAAGVEHSIPGYVKWRAPSGTVTSLVFSPSISTVLSISGGGTYPINSNKYIGIIFNGKTIDISSGTVDGNAASTGLLDVLNSYLSTFPALSVPDYSINESMGTLTITVSLSQASANEIRVKFSTSDGVAIVGTDYALGGGQLIFAPNQLIATFTVNVLADLLAEPSELFYVNLANPVNASITNSTSNITILDNPPLSVELTSFKAVCQESVTHIKWSTASEKNSDYFILECKIGDENWATIAKIESAGESSSNLNYFYNDGNAIIENKYYRLKQVDVDGTVKIYDPIAIRCLNVDLGMEIVPNPTNGAFQLLIKGVQKGSTIVRFCDLNGSTIIENTVLLNEMLNVIDIEKDLLSPGVYFVQVEQAGVFKNSKLIVH